MGKRMDKPHSSYIKYMYTPLVKWVICVVMGEGHFERNFRLCHYWDNLPCYGETQSVLLLLLLFVQFLSRPSIYPTISERLVTLCVALCLGESGRAHRHIFLRSR